MTSHPDMHSPHSHYDLILLVDGEKLYVNKSFLASHSTFFDRLFFGDFAEKGKEEVEIKDVVFEEFHCLLQVLFRAGRSVDDDNVEYLLKLADQFQIKAVIEECIRHLLQFTFDALPLIAIADQYRLIDLTRIIELSDARLQREVKKADFYIPLSMATKDAMIDRLLSLIDEHQCFPPLSPNY